MKTTTSHSAAPVELLGFVAPIRRLVHRRVLYGRRRSVRDWTLGDARSRPPDGSAEANLPSHRVSYAVKYYRLCHSDGAVAKPQHDLQRTYRHARLICRMAKRAPPFNVKRGRRRGCSNN
jgi:hypothetical protein